MLYLSSSLPSAPCLSSVIWCTVVYWVGFVVQRNNRSSVWIEEADEWCSLSRTKSPPLFFIDVLMRLSWLPSKFVLYTVVGLQADRCTWTLKAEKGFYAFFIVSIPLTLMNKIPYTGDHNKHVGSLDHPGESHVSVSSNNEDINTKHKQKSNKE